jgi:hypothetical protein
MIHYQWGSGRKLAAMSLMRFLAGLERAIIGKKAIVCRSTINLSFDFFGCHQPTTPRTRFLLDGFCYLLFALSLKDSHLI